MGNVLKTLILLLLSTASFGQVIQERNASGADRRIILKNGFRLPQVCNVSGNPDLLNYSAFDAKGAMVYDTCAGKIKRWSGSAWVAVADSGAGGGGSGDYVDTIYRKAGQDSIFYTINGGTERAVKDSVGSGGGGGFSLDSLAIARRGANLQHFVSTNSNSTGGTRAAVNSDISRDSANIFIGHRSGANATTSTNNTALGAGALRSNTTGNNNVAIGNLTLSSATTSGGQIAIGYKALNAYNVNSIQPNIAIGDNALVLATNYFNYAIGGYAGSGITSGSHNTLYGHGSGSGITTGNDNVVIGNNSVGNASYRIVIGNAALTSVGQGSVILAPGGATGFRPTVATGTNNYCMGCAMAGGNNNVGIGLSSQTANSTGNVAIGTYAYSNSQTASTHTGANTVAIGSSAFDRGGNTLGIITGANNIGIGAWAYPPDPTAANQIVFQVAGASHTSRGYNALTRFTGGQWLINQTTSAVTTATASAALEINGVTRGFLRPRTTTAERDAIASPAAGISVYNSSLATNDVYTTAWYQQPNGLTGSGTLDFPSTGAHSSSDLTITVTGAAVGDIVILGTPVQDIDGTFTAFVSAANTVTVRFNHYGSGNSNPASGTFKVYVIKN